MGRRASDCLPVKAATVYSGLTMSQVHCIHAVPHIDIIPVLHTSNPRLREANSLLLGPTAETHSCYLSLEKSRLGLTLKGWHLGEGSGLFCMTLKGSLWSWACASMAFHRLRVLKRSKWEAHGKRWDRRIWKDEECGFTS